MDCVFCKIRDRKIFKEFDYEDSDVMVFPDISPQKPVHLLVVPKKHIVDFLEFDDPVLLSKIKKVLDKMVKAKLNNKGYRISVNGGGSQIIDHLHFHIVGPIGKIKEM